MSCCLGPFKGGNERTRERERARGRRGNGQFGQQANHPVVSVAGLSRFFFALSIIARGWMRGRRRRRRGSASHGRPGVDEKKVEKVTLKVCPTSHPNQRQVCSQCDTRKTKLASKYQRAKAASSKRRAVSLLLLKQQQQHHSHHSSSPCA